MAGNEWINGYLEAILDSGAAASGGGGSGGGGSGAGGGGGGGDPKSPVAGASASPRGPHMNFSPTHYFVEEVVKGVDESDLHRTWIKVVATRNARERSTRLENMCWRIWHLARKKKQAIILINLFPCSFRLRSLNEWFLGLVGCSGGSSVFFPFFFS
jgi:sucrose-phosphate synthase